MSLDPLKGFFGKKIQKIRQKSSEKKEKEKEI
jgi:hypothetical protein